MSQYNKSIRLKKRQAGNMDRGPREWGPIKRFPHREIRSDFNLRDMVQQQQGRWKGGVKSRYRKYPK